MTTSEQTNEIDAALAKAQLEYGRAVKAKDNPHFKAKYADLASVIDATREALAANGLTITQWPEEPLDASRIRLTTRLGHSSGQWIMTTDSCPIVRANDPQSYYAANTYARRYGWMSVAGVAPEDDDGNGATPAKERTRQPARTREPAPESSGDRKAAGGAQPSDDELRTAQRAWHVALREHCGDLSPEDRHGFSSELLGVVVTTESGWNLKKYQFARQKLDAHIKACSIGKCEEGLCPLAAKAMGIPTT